MNNIIKKIEHTNLFNRCWKVYRKIKYYILSEYIVRRMNDNDQITEYSYNQLWPVIDNNPEKYFELLQRGQRAAIDKIRTRSQKKVGFLMYASSIWQYDSIYNMMLKSPQYEPVIIVCALNDGTEKTIFEQYKLTKQWLEIKNYKYVGVFKENENVSWDNLNLDVLFTSIPYINILPRRFEYGNLKMQTLLCYSPYGFAINEMSDRYFDMKIHNIAWKLFYETEIQKDMARKMARNKGENIVVSGYAKMDCFFDQMISSNDIKWKGNDKSKRIIWAPHHSLTRPSSRFATFDDNYMTILEMAQKYSDTTSWVIKPHPLLKKATIEYGLFSSENEYEDYMRQWEALPNAKVVLDGDYLNYFKTSDAIILDSESFLVEYQYTHKPLLFLKRETQTFNYFGEKVMDVVYSCNGKDTVKIEKFIKEVVIEDKDPMKPIRDDFYFKYLDYKTYNGGLNAASFVFTYLNDNLQ